MERSSECRRALVLQQGASGDGHGGLLVLRLRLFLCAAVRQDIIEQVDRNLGHEFDVV